jgi:glutathione S-transferase
MIKLYGAGISFHVAKVRYVLNYLNLKYDWQQTSPMAGETQTPEFLKISPTGKIPAIEIDGFKLFESGAITRYLASINNSPIYPQDAKKRALIDAWMEYVSIHVAHAMGRVLYNRVFAPMFDQKVDQESLKVGLDFLAKYFPVLDKQLSQNSHLAGNEFSLADISLLGILDPCEIAQVDVSKYPSIVKWRANLKSKPFYQACYKDYTQFAQDMFSAKAAK